MPFEFSPYLILALIVLSFRGIARAGKLAVAIYGSLWAAGLAVTAGPILVRAPAIPIAVFFLLGVLVWAAWHSSPEPTRQPARESRPRSELVDYVWSVVLCAAAGAVVGSALTFLLFGTASTLATGALVSTVPPTFTSLFHAFFRGQRGSVTCSESVFNHLFLAVFWGLFMQYLNLSIFFGVVLLTSAIIALLRVELPLSITNRSEGRTPGAPGRCE